MKFIENGTVTSPKGFLASGVHCGLKKNKLKKDLALIYSENKCVASAVYTKNAVKGAPLYVTKNHLKDGKAQAIIINSGNANTCNGESGLNDAKSMALYMGNALDLDPSDVLVASTGVIGVPLNIDAIKSGILPLKENLSVLGSNDASNAILTTDTFKKECALEFSIDNKTITIGCIAKGSGMIEPNMGTMLSFITTDINISKDLLDEALKSSVNISYNRVSVDGDTSTNDMVIVLANGQSKNKLIDEKNDDYYKFLDALNSINLKQARRIARDGEGATKLIECTVNGALTEKDGEILSKSVIKSSLVKTAIFGGDANWGRILCALGYADATIDPEKVNVYFKSGDEKLQVCNMGSSLPFDENKGREILLQDIIEIIIDLNIGDFSVTSFGCDLTYEYVKINGEYRS